MGQAVVEMNVGGSAITSSDTFVVAYPTGKTRANFQDSQAHVVFVPGMGEFYLAKDFTLTFGANSVTVNWDSAIDIPANATVFVGLEEGGDGDGDVVEHEEGVDALALPVVRVDLGVPATLDADGIIKAATGTELPNTETVTYTPDTDGVSPTDGAISVVTKSGVAYWELDVPRCLTVATTHGSSVVALSIVVTGLDVFGVALSETIAVAATGTSQADVGLKAFKWVRSIAITAAADAEANTVNIGWGNNLGLPVYLPSTEFVMVELEDGEAVGTGGTFAEAVQAAATATTGDVRGTVIPNTACNGAHSYGVVMILPEPGFRGVPQFGG